MRGLVAALAAVMAIGTFGAPSSAAADAFGGNPWDSPFTPTCIPITCSPEQPQALVYQQVFSGMSMFKLNRILIWSAETKRPIYGVYELNLTGKLYYTNASPSNMNADPAANLGEAIVMTPAANGAIGFLYDPSKGNLLLQLSPIERVIGEYLGPAAAEVNAPWTSSLYVLEGATESVRQDGGLMISFYTVPEPSTWAMMLLGFGAAGAVLRRRYAAQAVQ